MGGSSSLPYIDFTPLYKPLHVYFKVIAMLQIMYHKSMTISTNFNNFVIRFWLILSFLVLIAIIFISEIYPKSYSVHHCFIFCTQQQNQKLSLILKFCNFLVIKSSIFIFVAFSGQASHFRETERAIPG